MTTFPLDRPRRAVACLTLALTITTVTVRAQDGGKQLPEGAAQFTGIVGFGDSYADTGDVPGGAFRLLGWRSCPVGPAAQGYPTCRFTGGDTNFVDSLRAIYRLPTLTNFAIGGARTDTTNNFPVAKAGFANEVDAFLATGRRFTSHELVVLSIGGNDTTMVAGADSLERTNARATTAAANAVAGVLRLVAAGATNIAWFGAGNSALFPAPQGGSDGRTLTTIQRTAWAHTYFREIQERLAASARSGVRIFLFDFETLQARLLENPGPYGFASATGCQGVRGSVGCFYWNGVHPDTAGMALVASYMANQIDAPLTVVPQGRITTTIAAGFAASVFDRLEAYRTFAPASAPGGRGALYGQVEYGRARDTSHDAPAAQQRHAVAGAVGADFRLAPAVTVGATFGESDSTVAIGVEDGHDRVRAYQAGGYGSFTGDRAFADAVVAYGRYQHGLDRRGVIDVIHAAPHAGSYTAAARGGYLFAMGPLRGGPVVGVSGTRAVIDAYTETGDELVAMSVDRQVVASLTGDAGLELRLPLRRNASRYSPFLAVTAEHDRRESARVVTSTQVTTMLLPVRTPVSQAGRTHGKLAGGVAAALGAHLSASATAAASFADGDRNDVAVSGGFLVSF